MTGRIKMISFLMFAVAMAARYGVHGFMEGEVIDLWSPYTESAMPILPIAKYHEHYMKNTESNLEDLIKKNPALEKLMVQAKGLLQMKLLQWADVVGQMALIDRQLSQYVRQAEQPEPELLLEYAQWIVSHDHTAVKGLMEEMRKLVRPLFTSQGVLQLVFDFMLTLAARKFRFLLGKQQAQ